MNKDKIRKLILNYAITRELFFFFGRRKANLKRIDNAINKRNIKTSVQRASGVIVSLTTYGERIKELKYTLYSLVTQSIKTDAIILNLAYEDEKYITEDIKMFEDYGVEFSFCKDIKSYKKLIPTLQRFPDACIITVDDDIYYEKKWLYKLYKSHLKYPEDVCCHLEYKITYDNNKINTYQKWNHNYKIEGEDNSIFIIGCSGILYPPHVFYKDIMNEELFTKLAPIGDDIWFWFMVRLNDKKIRQITKPITNLRFINPYREYGIIKGTTLMQQNVGQNKNDIQFNAVLDYYNISQEKLITFLEGNSIKLLNK